MKDLLILLGHLLTTVAKLLGPGGAKAVMDQFTRRIIGFGVQAGDVDATALCHTPAVLAGSTSKLQTTLSNLGWQSHCQGLYQLLTAA